MTLEFEAESKAAAERKASQQGMEVRSVREVGGPATTDPPPRGKGSSGGLVRLVVVLIVLVAVLWVFRRPLLQLTGR